MTVKEIVSLLHADILHTGAYLDTEINAAFGSDMMSDTLAYADSHTLLLTGLCTLQVLRTVEMLDIPVIVFVRGKIPSEDMLELADKDDHVQCLRHPVSGRAERRRAPWLKKTLSY